MLSNFCRTLFLVLQILSCCTVFGLLVNNKDLSNNEKDAIQTKFILTNTHHPGNVGASARSIKTMGFKELILVSPRDPKVLNRVRTKESASGAVDILEGARIYDTLLDVLDGNDIDIICGTGMPNDMPSSSPRPTKQEQQQQQSFNKNRIYNAPRPCFEEFIGRNNNSNNNDDNRKIKSIAFVFGNERFGMTQEDMDICNVILGIPTNPSFGSLNLASAVQLIAYDWRQALGGFKSLDE